MKVIARGLVICVLLLAGAGQTNAQGTYPDRPVRLIVPFAPAGPVDVVARLIGQKLTERFGKQFFVENQAGAGGNLGMGNAAKAAPDGHTILFVSSSYVVNPSLYARVPYDPFKDFVPVTVAGDVANTLIVHPSLAARSVNELIELIKASPGKYNYAHAGVGTTPHLAGELFKQRYAPDLVTVPFPGAAPAVSATLGGHTPIGFTALPPAMNNIKEGKLRGLALLAARRSPFLPDLPTNAEAGVPDLESDTLTGVVAPAGTPRELIDKWRDAIAKVVAEPDVKQRLETLGFVPVANSPEEFGERIKTEIGRWGKVVRDANIGAD